MFSKLKSLGPGLLYAGAAIGVSHLVQSTRAGAQYGYILIIAIVVAHFFKYPFFALGPRYATQSNQSLIAGFAKLGKWSVWTLLAATVSTMFTIQAAVTIVTAGLIQKMTGLQLTAPQISMGLLVVCFFILTLGRFSVLENIMRVVIVVLALSTCVAVLLSFGIKPDQLNAKQMFSLSREQDVSFLISFAGWMPAPLDLAIWHSIWTLSQKTKNNTTPKNFDFNVGFYGTAFLAICFVILGANTLYGTRVNLDPTAAGFASQLIDSFTTTLGSWSYWVILIAAFTTMFSTTLTCLDAIPRVMHHIGLELHFNKKVNTYRFWMSILIFGTCIILFFFVASMGQMVHLATVVSFLTAPIIAYLCYTLVNKTDKDQELWSNGEKRLAGIAIIVLLGLSLFYLFQIS